MKMKLLIILLFSVMFHYGQTQDLYFTRTGKIDFHAGTSIEDIDGTNNEVASMLNIKTGEIAFTVLIKSFHFKRALMEEHFNENYLESTKFPKASFKGKVIKTSSVNFTSNGSFTATIEGELNIHGIVKKVSTPAKFTVNNGKITGMASFTLLISDFNIEIPGVVADKIAKEAQINVNCLYEPRY
jgi:polyisoprenoid-binding protein YceI